jgi:ATP-dependent DNA helicase DinG
MFWLTSTKSGDKSELNIMPAQNIYWGELNSDQDSCLGPACPWYHRNCFVSKARKQAEAADILIANHSLLLADIKVQNKLLPSYDYLIIDEAHHLEETATEQLGWTIGMNSLRLTFFHLNRGFGGSLGPGLLSQLKLILKNYGDELSLVEHELIDKTINECFDTVKSIHDTIKEMEDVITAWCSRLLDGTDDDNYQTIRVKSNHRQGIYWDAFIAVKDNYILRTGNLVKMLNKLQNYFESVSEEQVNSLAALRKDIDFQIQGMLEVNCNLAAFSEGSGEYVYWLEIDNGQKPEARIKCAPVSVSQLLYENLFLTKKSTILTSATISVEGNFEHFTERIGLQAFPEEKLVKHSLTSPFSYETQSLLCVVRDLPDPAAVEEKEYIDSITPMIFHTAKIFGGKTLVLFTSHRMLRETYFKLMPQLEQEGIGLLGHKIDGGRSRLTEEFRKAKHAVLFGASSFWEGIDLPGDILKCVIIVRLPFAPPNSPIVEARLEELVKNRKDAFSCYSLPEAVIKLKQGFGRLIRAEDDDGVVVILDRRIVDRKYGRRFLNSLPTKTHFKGDTSTVLKKINNWALGERPVRLKLLPPFIFK